ncbi:hypothetical protein [Accumulibacter sp.]|uniref:hypothetical protein n=1 Tax=Accumulibacter sp. TaxID=2053492 RepID=UPI0025E4B266|nr:hypothetical protein [Accumulibacter sp.]MCM8594600.1 hypothetical protein [Accumulibacter sp.]MCM8627237.1 hypothetical protein [Accumulibacter sp.]MDS4048746.1 hypothetical protein [Accumulibacter sp.]
MLIGIAALRLPFAYWLPRQATTETILMIENKGPFTAGRVAKHCCEAGKQESFLWDTESAGLGLKASAGDAKNCILQSRLETGATMRLTIGSTTAWTLAAARTEAR